MALKICVLASGSSANCTYVASENTHILIDAGLSGRETAARLDSVGTDPEHILGVCVTHEHEDHKASLRVLHRRFGTSLYANAGTIEAIERGGRFAGLPWNVFTTGSPFRIGDLELQPFSVPHDSLDPVGFVVGDASVRAGIVTDMGTPTALIRERLRRCHVLVLESNHDGELLRAANRPWSLKQRIAGRQGHLSNEQAAELLAEVAGPELKCVFLAHLSAECNRPELALRTVRQVLEARGYGQVDVKLTFPDRPSDLVTL